ncbi:MAG: phospho-N-acetylmuramoyl-pentapeptide-transferase, partial [uncultured bacterium]
MLLWLSDWLANYFHFFHVVQYLTLRAILGTLTALAMALFLGPTIIRRLSSHRVGQVVRDDGPQSHLSKAGTPTMGGMLIIISVTLSTLLWSDLTNKYVWLVLMVMLGFGAIGYWDDYRKLVLKHSRGMPARQKYLFQSLLGFGAALYLYYTAKLPVETELVLPFFKNMYIYMGPFFIIFSYFVIVGSSNAVNLTDGLDGLAIMPCVMISGALGVFAYVTGNLHYSTYLAIP